MIHRIQKSIVLLISYCVLLVSCSKPAEEKFNITQSNLVYEDNVNGRVPPPDNVIESINFYYNDNGTLQRATVYDDTSASAHLLKEINMTYFPEKVVVSSFLDTLGSEIYTIGFNDKKQVTSVALPDSSGLYLSYFNDRISRINIYPTGSEYINFIYDDNDNLLQYELKAGDSIIAQSILEYNDDQISYEFDSRFLIKGIKFIYLGGLDLISKLGLNYGKPTKNKLISRNDILRNGAIFEHYDYGYTSNSNAEIVKRNVRFSTDTLFYQFKY